ncbi:MAG: DHH family phosphoesterase [Phycisphaerales bacterium]
MSTYTSNSTPDQMAAWLKSRKKVIICTHAKPDGDALGSTVGLSRALAHAGVQSELWLIGPFPEWTDAVVGSTPVKKLSSENTQIPASGNDADGIAVCDTGSWNQLEGLRTWLTGKADKAIILDHHLHGHADVAHKRLVVTNAAAASHVVADVATHLLKLAQPPHCRSTSPRPSTWASQLTPAGCASATSLPTRSAWPHACLTAASTILPCTRWSSSSKNQRARSCSAARSAA